jgi:hypothetical protein
MIGDRLSSITIALPRSTRKPLCVQLVEVFVGRLASAAEIARLEIAKRLLGMALAGLSGGWGQPPYKKNRISQILILFLAML